MNQCFDETISVKIRYHKLIFPRSYDVSDGDSLIVTRSVRDPNCLEIYTMAHWLIKMSGFERCDTKRGVLFNASMRRNDHKRAIFRYVAGNAEEVIVKGGGIRLPSDLMKEAGLSREVIWNQHEDRVDICNPNICSKIST